MNPNILKLNFQKFHALGNDYLVLDPQENPVIDQKYLPLLVQKICNRHKGIGSDGVLYGPIIKKNSTIQFVQIFNPDGSEAERSGNGLRIFAAYVYQNNYIPKAYFQESHFTVQTLKDSSTIKANIQEYPNKIQLEMGPATFFDTKLVPKLSQTLVAIPLELQNENLILIHRVCVGNPHCVVECDEINKELACRLGPKIEKHSLFPQRTNVQFMKVLNSNEIQIEIWERGAGYTMSSGTSSVAAACVAHKLGRVKEKIIVHTPGGLLEVTIKLNGNILLTGPVEFVASGFFFLHNFP